MSTCYNDHIVYINNIDVRIREAGEGPDSGDQHLDDHLLALPLPSRPPDVLKAFQTGEPAMPVLAHKTGSGALYLKQS